MGRPAKHSADDFVDAAIAIFADQGIRAVTLGSVAAALNAANGSVYHRFPDRPALLAAVWSRTTQRFTEQYLDRIGEPTVDSAIESACWVVDWCAARLPEAQVLQAGARTFGVDDGRLHAEGDPRAAIRRIVAALSPSTTADPDQIAFALTDLPIAVVRGPLQEGRAPGEREARLVRSLVTLILTPRR